jgi:hypothetical protein
MAVGYVIYCFVGDALSRYRSHHVCFGSFAELPAALPNVRSTAESDFGSEKLSYRPQVSVDASKQSHTLVDQTQAV